jgi:hypothetical protein
MFLSTTPTKRNGVIDGACSSKCRIHAWKNLPRTDCLGPLDCRISTNPARPIRPRHIAGSDSRVIDMQTTKQLQRFYVDEVFQTQPYIPGSQGSETVSLPCGTRPLTSGNISKESTVRASKGQALQLAHNLDFLSIQAYRLWMEYPSRGR